jgi:glyoxylase-like metal-dependent hydrolase (beta-lactamase superfamily II)
MNPPDVAQPPRASLNIEVYTSPLRNFTSSTVSEGPGDEPTWSPSSATLIWGEHDAILVDTPAPDEQVDALADWIESKGKRLVYVYVTHGHGDLVKLSARTLRSSRTSTSMPSDGRPKVSVHS